MFAADVDGFDVDDAGLGEAGLAGFAWIFVEEAAAAAVAVAQHAAFLLQVLPFLGASSSSYGCFS